MRRHAVALAAGALALAPAAAFAGPTINVGQPSASGYLKGPDVRFTWQVDWAPNSVVQVVEYKATPVGGGTPVSRISAGNSGLGATILPLADGRYDVTAQARQTVSGDGGFEFDPGPVVNVGRFGVDSVPPGPGTFTLADGAEFTNRFSVAAEGVNGSPVVIGGAGGSSAWFYELRQSPADFAGCSRTVPTVFTDGTGCGGLGSSQFRISRFFRKDVILPPGHDGVRTVWVRFRDAAYIPCDLGGFACIHDGDGNASAPISDSVILDTTAPAIALRAGKTVTGQAGAPVAFDAGASTDATSGVDPAGFRWDFKDGSPVVDNAGAVVEHTYPGPGSYPGEVRGRDKAGNPAVFAFTAFVGVAPPADGGGQGPLEGPGGQEPPPANPGGAQDPPAGGAGGAAPAPPGPVVVIPKPKVLRVRVDDDKAFVNVNDDGVMRVRIETLKGRKVAAFSQAVDQGRNRLKVPRRLGPRIPDAGRLVLEMQVVSDGVAGPVISRRIDAVALNPQPLPPKARGVPR